MIIHYDELRETCLVFLFCSMNYNISSYVESIIQQVSLVSFNNLISIETALIVYCHYDFGQILF